MLIRAQDLMPLLDSPTVRIFDCRAELGNPDYGPAMYATGHIPGARFLHLDRDLSSPVIPGKTGRHPLPDPERLCATLRAAGLNQGDEVVIYDDGNNMYSVRLWWLLRWLGHDRVRLLDGGWAAWRAAGGTLASTEAAAVPGDFQGAPDPTRLASAEELMFRLHAPNLALLDARSEARYRGDVEPIDPVAGHIPGAISAPFGANLDRDGYFLSPEALRQRFATLTEGRAETVCYCGSGVTACHNIFAMVLAGLPEPRLYAGSWSEWLTDPARPVARA